MRLRAPRHEEAAAVLAVIVARDVADIGRPDYTLQDVRDDWALPGLDLARDVFVVEDADGTLIGWADVDERVARVSVHPDHDGRGVGTMLRRAVEARMRERGFRMRQDVDPANAAAVEHVRAAGYERIQVHLRMRGPLQAAPAPGPPGAAVRRLDLPREGRAAHALVQEAFAEVHATAGVSFEIWLAEAVAGSAPEFRLALDDEAGLLGVALGERWEDGVGYVAQLAVAPRGRGQGHGPRPAARPPGRLSPGRAVDRRAVRGRCECTGHGALRVGWPRRRAGA